MDRAEGLSICHCGRTSEVVVVAEHRSSISFCEIHARQRLSELEVSGLDNVELRLILMVLMEELRNAWRLTGGSR
jgi:hypothetical protein